MFGVLPHAGGTFDQPARLMNEMRQVVTAFRAEERRRIEAAR